MKKSRAVGKRLIRLRNDRKLTQVEFAEVLKVTQPMVSAWESGKGEMPSCAFLVRFGNLASYPDNIWFWERAGMDRKAMDTALDEILKERSMPPEKGEIVRVPCVQMTPEGIKDTGRLRPLDAQGVPSPFSTVCFVVDDYAANPMVPKGHIFVLDTSQNDAKDLRPFWGENVLVDVQIGGGSYHTVDMFEGFGIMSPGASWPAQVMGRWPRILTIGRLQCQRIVDVIPGIHYHVYAAVLGAFADSRTETDANHGDVRLAAWHHPSNYEKGSDKEIAAVAAEARTQALSEMRLEPHDRIIGRVIDWSAPQEGQK